MIVSSRMTKIAPVITILTPDQYDFKDDFSRLQALHYQSSHIFMPDETGINHFDWSHLVGSIKPKETFPLARDVIVRFKSEKTETVDGIEVTILRFRVENKSVEISNYDRTWRKFEVSGILYQIIGTGVFYTIEGCYLCYRITSNNFASLALEA